MRRLFLWLGCAAILERCPRAERMRAAATGAGVLVVAVLAALSATVTAYQFLHVPVPGAVLLGAGWGAAIMALDRSMILSIRRQSTWWPTLALALPGGRYSRRRRTRDRQAWRMYYGRRKASGRTTLVVGPPLTRIHSSLTSCQNPYVAV